MRFLFILFLFLGLSGCISARDEMVFDQVEGFRQIRPGFDLQELFYRRKACSIVSTYASALTEADKKYQPGIYALVGSVCRSAGIFTKKDIDTWQRVYGDGDVRVFPDAKLKPYSSSVKADKERGGQDTTPNSAINNANQQ